MRRYDPSKPGTVVPGRNTGLRLVLRPVSPEPEPEPEPAPCEPAISGLFWFSDSTGAFDQDVEAAYLLPEGAAGPTLAVAALRGETCGLPVTWTRDWTPAVEDGAAPGAFEDGARLVVYPLADTAPGVLEVSAEHAGQPYGPILLGVLRYSCYCYGSGARVLAWFDFHTVFSASGLEGISWTANPKTITPSTNAGQVNATLSLNGGDELPPGTLRVRLSFTPDEPGDWQFRFYMDTVEASFYLYHTDAQPAIFEIAAAYSQLTLYFPYAWTDGSLTLEIECYGPA